MRRILLTAALAVFVTACGPSTSPSFPAFPSGSAGASSTPAFADLPVGCQPLDLRSPTGEAVDLTGQWAGSGHLVGQEDTAWLIQLGDCVEGSVDSTELPSDLGSDIVRRTNLIGHVASDFRVNFDVIILDQPPGAQRFAEFSTMVMLIEWDADGQLRLREDRERGTEANRCRNVQCPGATTAPIPVIWYRADQPT